MFNYKNIRDMKWDEFTVDEQTHLRWWIKIMIMTKSSYPEERKTFMKKANQMLIDHGLDRNKIPSWAWGRIKEEEVPMEFLNENGNKTRARDIGKKRNKKTGANIITDILRTLGEPPADMHLKQIEEKFIQFAPNTQRTENFPNQIRARCNEGVNSGRFIRTRGDTGYYRLA